MRLFVAKAWNEHEDEEILGVFSTFGNAVAEIEEHVRQHTLFEGWSGQYDYDYYAVMEEELDKPFLVPYTLEMHQEEERRLHIVHDYRQHNLLMLQQYLDTEDIL